jgi:IclR family pca regulon transcriptional regulator
MGKVLLAGLDDERLAPFLSKRKLPRLTPNTITEPAEMRRELAHTRERGWAINDEEIEIGLRSIAVRIRDRSGATCAAVNISAPAARASVEQLHDWLPVLQRAADAIGLMMTHR